MKQCIPAKAPHRANQPPNWLGFSSKRERETAPANELQAVESRPSSFKRDLLGTKETNAGDRSAEGESELLALAKEP